MAKCQRAKNPFSTTANRTFWCPVCGLLWTNLSKPDRECKGRTKLRAFEKPLNSPDMTGQDGGGVKGANE